MILLVDDELLYLRPYIEELELEGIPVRTTSSVPAARQILAGPEAVELVILDIMLPWPPDSRSDEETQPTYGGLGLFQEIRTQRPDLPVVLFTNARSAKRRVTIDSRTHLCHKAEYLPYQFVQFIKDLLDTGQK